MLTKQQHATFELRDVPVSDPWDTIRRGSRLVSRRVGLIRQIAESAFQAQDPAIFTTGLRLADFSQAVPDGRMLSASGASDSAAGALVAAIGEAAERHAACFFDRDEMVLGTSRELAEDAASPDALRLFSREQVERLGLRNLTYFDEQTRIRWVWGHSLADGRPRLVPAAYVYLNYRPEPDEAWIGYTSSTGLAAGATREEAILGALLETVERDAFTLAWMHRRPGRRLEINHDELRRTMSLRLRVPHPSVDLQFFDLTTDIPIPVVFAIMRRQAEMGPVVCQGLASRVSPTVAVRKCIHEAGQNFPFIRNLLSGERNWHPAEDFTNVSTFDHHFLTYLKRPDLVRRAFAFFDQCEDRASLSTLPDHATGRVLGDIDYCVSQLRKAGYEAIVVDVTAPDIAEVGLSVVRVIVPGLVPLHSHHLRPFLGVRRLFEAAQRLGWNQNGHGDHGLNSMPHPFP